MPIGKIRTPRPHRIAWGAMVAVLALLGLLLVREFSRPSIRMDGIGYYMPLASLAFDGDLDLRNQVGQLDNYMRRRYFIGADGRLVDPFAVGAAMLWAPAILMVRAGDPARASFGRPDRWRNASPGFGERYVRAIAITSGLEVVLGSMLLVVVLRRRVGAIAAGTAVAAAVLGTPVVYYALSDPSYAHAASFLAAAALLVAAVSSRRLPLPLLGALWGLAAVVRWQDAVLGVWLAPRLVDELRAARARGAIGIVRSITAFLVPALVVFTPQMILWQRLYGSLLLVPMGSGFMHWGRPRVLELLFSTWHGAFVWSPILLLGLASLAWLPDRRQRLALWIGAALTIYASASADDWWGSAAFGARRLVSLAPLAGLGIATGLAHLARGRGWALRLAYALTVCAMLWNLRLVQYNLRGFLPANPGNYREYARHYPPGDPHREPYRLWDHARLLEEIVVAERAMWGKR